MDAKSIFVSRTFWVNTLALIASVAASFGIDLGLTEEVQASIVVGILAVANIVLRLVTKAPVNVTGVNP
jgi:hypothetical protein